MLEASLLEAYCFASVDSHMTHRKKKKQASLSSTRGSRGQAEPEDGGTPIFCRARYVVMHPQMVGRAKTCPVRVMRNTGAGFEYMRYVRVLEGNRSPSLEVSLF